MKYELVSISVNIKGKVFRKKDENLLDDSKLPEDLLKAAYKNGFIKPKGSKAVTSVDVIAQYLAEKSIPAPVESEFPDDMPSREVLIENGILTFVQLNAIDDFTTLNGIGPAGDKLLKAWILEKFPAPVESDFPDDIPYKEILIENKILTIAQLKATDDLTSLDGIEDAEKESLMEWLKDK